MNNPTPVSVAHEHPLASSYRGFSCPYEKFDEPFFEAVATNLAQVAVRLFLNNHSAELEQKGRGLVSLLENWLAGETTFPTIWDPAFGAALSALAEGREVAPIDAAAAIALRVSAQGRAAHCEARLSRPTRLFWHHWLLPRADAFSVESDGRRARLRLRHGDTVREAEFTLTGEGWRGVGAEELPRVGPPREGITLLSRDAVGEADLQELGTSLMENIEGGDVEGCSQALRILELYAPPYQLWVSRVIRRVILLRVEDGVMKSGSTNKLLGLIYMSSSRKPMPLAEMLVHEASHQYLNLLCRVGPISDGTDATLYYSPAVRRPRPLERILVAYHAFANMELLYRRCLDGGIDDDGYCASNQATLLPQLEQLESPLLDNPALTPVGRALFEPLFRRLH